MTVEQKVRNLYKALLGREPDPSGFKYWVNVAKTKGFNEVVKNFANSSEVKRKLGGKSIQEVIRHIYRNAFGREPDAGGMKFWFNIARTKSFNPAFLAAAITEGARGSDVERLRMPAGATRTSAGSARSISTPAYHEETVSQPSASSIMSELVKVFEESMRRASEQQRAAKPKFAAAAEEGYVKSMLPSMVSKPPGGNLMTYEQYLDKLRPPLEKQAAETFAAYEGEEESEREKKIKYALIAGLGLLTLAMILNRR